MCTISAYTDVTENREIFTVTDMNVFMFYVNLQLFQRQD